jgi:predicted transcriptional regulator
MTHVEFTSALIRLSRFKVGVIEACTLFCLSEETTAAQVAKATKADNNIAKARIGILKGKKLVESVNHKDRSTTYRLTERGRSIVNSTLKLKP